MQRRDLIRVVGGIAAAGTISIAGCSGSGNGTSGEVTTNELSDKLTVQSHRASFEEDGGYLYLTVENTTSETVNFWYRGRLYSGDELVRESRKNKAAAAANEQEEFRRSFFVSAKDFGRYELDIYQF